MHYQQILVYLDDGASNAARVAFALSIARAHKASLTGSVVNSMPDDRFLRPLGFSDYDAALAYVRAESDRLLHDFTQRCDDAGVPSDTRALECKRGRPGAKLARVARLYDLIVLRQANPDKPSAAYVSALTEDTLLSCGRPVVCVPYTGAHTMPCRHAVIAWDGSRAASRAVHDALPWLEHTDAVTVLVVNPDRVETVSDRAPGEGLVAHLIAHGIHAGLKPIDAGDISTSSAILNYLSDSAADVLVMGGYGTARLREIVLGGVTQSVLQSMTAPVFMSH